MKAITLEDLFVKPLKVEIPVPGKTEARDDGVPDIPKLAVWVRPADQSERDLAAAAARKASRTLRKLLETEGTEERENLVLSEVEEADSDSLKAIWVSEKLADRAARLRRQSLEDREYIEEPEGDDITLKEMDDYENAVEDSEESRELSLAESIIRAREELQKEIDKVPEAELKQMAIPVQIEAMCKRASENEFVLQLIYRCTFSDKKLSKRAFNSIDQVHMLRDVPLNQLTNAHMSFLLDPEQVKNLAGGLRRLS